MDEQDQFAELFFIMQGRDAALSMRPVRMTSG
jgi:hypothetical protein